MGDNFKISTDNIRMATLQLLKENLAFSMVVADMMLPLYSQAKNIDPEQAEAEVAKLYVTKLKSIDDYIKAEFGHLDIDNLLKK